MPALAKHMAMPLPMVPAPITAAERIAAGFTSAGRPGIFAAVRSAENTYVSAARCGLTLHSS
jgi:hypothetical protein